MITMSVCIVVYFHTSVAIFLRMMAGAGITVSRSMTEKFQLEIRFPNILASVLSTCVGHILVVFFSLLFPLCFLEHPLHLDSTLEPDLLITLITILQE